MNEIAVSHLHHINTDGRGKVFEWCRGDVGEELQIWYLKRGENLSGGGRYFVVEGKLELATHQAQAIAEKETQVVFTAAQGHMHALEDTLLISYTQNTPRREAQPELRDEILLKDLETLFQQPKGYAWCSGLPGKQITLYFRNKGDPCGGHFHKGEDPSKNPERFLPLQGRLHLYTFNGKRLQDFHLKPGQELIIPPNILHFLAIEEDSVFVEYRTTVFDRNHPDSYTFEHYPEHMREESLPFNEDEFNSFQEAFRKYQLK